MKMKRFIEIELMSDLCSYKFKVTDKEAISFISSHLEAGRSFEIFFPKWEI
jgi:hypothetical protein